MLRRIVLALCALLLALGPAAAQLRLGRLHGGFQFVATWADPAAVYDADFANGLYTAGPPSVSRASPGYAADNAGTYALFGNDTLRRTNVGLADEPADTNTIRNSAGQGAVAGSPGTPPTNAFTSISNGGTLARQIVSFGVENGIDYTEYRFYGTTSGPGGVGIYFESNNSIAASSGQSWTPSLFHRLSAGSWAGISAQGFVIDENTSTGSFVAGGSLSAVSAPTSATLGSQRVSASRTLSGGATVGAINVSYRASWAGSVALDFTVRIGWPHLSQGQRTLSPIRTTSGAVTRQADVVALPVAGVGRIVITYDDGSTQTFTGISTATPWTIPAANLNRSVIRRLTGYAS